MKYVFLGAFLFLTALSVVAYLMQPQPYDPRIARLTFMEEHADQDHDHVVSLSEAQSFFSSLATGNPKKIQLPSNTLPDTRTRIISFLVEEMDADGDDCVTEQEFTTGFKAMDRNHDGVLSLLDRPEHPPIQLTWCSDDNPVRREQIRLFNRLHPDYVVRLDPQNSQLEKVIVQSLAGVGPDLFDCYNGYALSVFVRSGIALDITDFCREKGFSPEDDWPAVRPLILHDGRIYGQPDNANAYAFWYNKDIFDEAGIPYPKPDWTWEDCIRIAQQLTRRNERGQIIRYGIIGYWDWKLGLFQHGAHFFSPQGTRATLDTPEAIAGMQFMQDLIHKYHVMPTLKAQEALASSGGWGTGEIALFGAGRSAMAIGGRWWLCILRSASYRHLRLGVAPIPRLQLPDGTWSVRNYGGGRSTLVNAQGKHIQGALLFMEFLHSRAWNELINRQADALAPVIKYNYTPTFEHDPRHPEEDYNVVWRTALENAEPEEVSPYVNGQYVDRVLREQTDMVRENLKSAAQAMRDVTRKINQSILENLKRDPELRARYRKAIQNGARPAWDRPDEIPWGNAQ